MKEPNAKRALVEQILRHATEYSWTVATGRLTLMLERDAVCINVFDERFEQPYTRIHSHRMDFKSQIIAGEMRHYRYTRAEAAGAVEYGCQELTLENKPVGSVSKSWLIEGAEEHFAAGAEYEITAPEIHRADARDGTVTLVTRQFKTEPTTIFAFWPLPLSASRPAIPFGTRATPELVTEVIDRALQRFSSGGSDLKSRSPLAGRGLDRIRISV